MKRILILISIMFLAGCVSGFDVKKANTYLLSHPDRPAQIKEALSVGEVVVEMNEEEVSICMGKPNTVTTTQRYPSNEKTTVWSYLRGAPSKRVFIFFMDGAVAGVNEITQTGTIISTGTINSGPILVPKSPGSTIIQRSRISLPSVNRKCLK